MNRIFKYYKNCKGITLVLMAFILAVLLMLAGLAIDIAYMYYVKNQLQVAADASALAGAARLDGTNSTVQTAARAEAVTFAAKNSAAGSPVVLAPNDVIVGYWDGSSFSTGSGMITNAVQVVARRDETEENSPRRQVRVFIGQIFRIINADWSFMSARASAIASKPPRASSFIALCFPVCSIGGSVCSYPTICSFDPPRIFDTGPGEPYNTKFAWTTLLEQPTSSSRLDTLICTVSPYQDVCNKNIWTTMGATTNTLRNFESVMFDPNFDAANKEKDGSGNVIGWWIIVPITAICPPGASGSNFDPKLVTSYALIRIKAVCATGVGNPCRPYSAPAALCSPYPGNVIVVDRISCIGCDDPDLMIGLRPVLVR